jgi:RNA polymerase sigma-70 factor (ECF subfamily)
VVSDSPRLPRVIPGGRSGCAPAAPPPDDVQLLSAIRAGDPAVASAFYARTRPAVERTVRRMLGHSDSELDDLVQIAMIELIRSLDSYRGDCALDTWITTLSARVVYKHLRRRGLERRIFDPEPPAEDIASRGHQLPVVRGLLRRILQHLERLTTERAWAFLLHDVYGYDLEETAAIVGASVGATQSRLVRGRRDLHRLIADDSDLAGALESWEGTS